MIIKITTVIAFILLLYPSRIYSQVYRELDPSTNEITFITDRFLLTTTDPSIIRAEAAYGYAYGDFYFILAYVTKQNNLSFKQLTTMEVTIDNNRALADIFMKDSGYLDYSNIKANMYTVGISLNFEDMNLISRSKNFEVTFAGTKFTVPLNSLTLVQKLLIEVKSK